MIKVVFFDLYGTLAGFDPSRFDIQSRACAEFDIALTPEGVLRGYALADVYMAEQNVSNPLRQLEGPDRDRFFAEYERRVLLGAGVEVSTERAAEIWRRVRQQQYDMALYDDVVATLSGLKDRGLMLGLISNMNRGGADLARSLGLKPYLDVAMTSKETGAEKPSPVIFRAALAAAGSQAEGAVHVGDQLTSDIDGARAVGIQPVLLDRDGNHPGYSECPRIQGLDELSGVLDRLAADAPPTG